MEIKNLQEWEDKVVPLFHEHKPQFGAWDTETTGLNIKTDTPFLIIFGWYSSKTKEDIVFRFGPELLPEMYKLTVNLRFLLAHNAKYDLHMLANAGYPYPIDKVDNKTHSISDTYVMARLITPTDIMGGLGLKALAIKYLDLESANDNSALIKDTIKKMNAERVKVLNAMLKPMKWSNTKIKANLKDNFKDYNEIPEEVREVYEVWKEEYGEATYADIDKELMDEYAENDVLWVLQLFRVMLPIIKKSKQVSTWDRETKALIPYFEQERVGFKIDIDYLYKARDNTRVYLKRILDQLNNIWLEIKPTLIKEINTTKNEIFQRLLTRGYDIVEADTKMEEQSKGLFPKLETIQKTTNITSGQKALQKAIFEYVYGIKIAKVDKRHLKKIIAHKDASDDVKEFCKLIITARTVEKWLSTYIIGYIKKYDSYGDGRVYTTANQAGTVSGRISSDFQQFPKGVLKDHKGNVLFEPRRMVLVDDGFKFVFIDESQHELRILANWSHQVGNPAINLSRAYVPYGLDGQNKEDWVPTDLHTLTATNAFGKDAVDLPTWKKLRGFGKMTNFAIVYGSGLNGLTDGELGDNLDRKDIVALYEGYWEAHPELKTFNNWVQDQVNQHGYVTNFYGRRFYVDNKRFAYKVANYLVQGSAADMLKEAFWPIYEFLRDYESKMVFSIHDEIIFSIRDGEEHLIPILKKMLEPKEDWMQIPMIADVEVSTTTWADKEDYELEPVKEIEIDDFF